MNEVYPFSTTRIYDELSGWVRGAHGALGDSIEVIILAVHRQFCSMYTETVLSSLVAIPLRRDPSLAEPQIL